ncbi:MAG TPA: NAD-binding protein [Sediminibacterium sp.]
MNLRKIRPFIYPLLILLVFVFSIIGYYQTLDKDFNLLGVIFAIFNFFIMNDADPTAVASNGFLMAAKYLAAFLVGVSLFTLSYKFVRRLWLSYKIRLTYQHHIVIFSLDPLGYRISKELLGKGYKVVVVEDNDTNAFIEEIENDGGVVINANPFESKTLDMVGLSNARVCILAYEKDETNIEIAGHISSYSYALFPQNPDPDHEVLKLMMHVDDLNNKSVIKDYFDINNTDEHYDLYTFNLHQLAAQKVYDEFSPHRFFRTGSEEHAKSIAIIGCDKTAEAFILENIILSHYHAPKPLTIYLVDKDVDVFFHQFAYQYPFHAEFVQLVPVKLLNGNFFANFTWSKEHIEKLSQVKAAYFFGQQDSVIMNTAAAFRQFLYTQTLSMSQVPLIVSLPEDSGIYDFLNNSTLHKDEVEQLLNNTLNQYYIKRKSDTFSGKSIIEEAEMTDTISRVINFYYSVLYELPGILKEKFGAEISQPVTDDLSNFIISFPDTHATFTEKEFEQAFFAYLSAKTGVDAGKLYHAASIKKQWNLLNNRKKDSNRYAARHMHIKLFIMEEIGCTPVNRENIVRFYPRLASVEHTRWSGEKMVFNYKYGPFPADKKEKNILKEVLKIHDQLIPYEKLTQGEKDKDLNLFLLLPLLNVLKRSMNK